jgi:hypothetical protein
MALRRIYLSETWRISLTGLGAILVFSSCTMILSTNVPGKTETSLPKEWLGKYEVMSEARMPDRKDSTKAEKEFATIESNRITWESTDGIKVFSLGDSLRYSVIYGQSRYLSLLMPQGLYAVFKVEKKDGTLELYSLSSDDEEIRKSDLNEYFDNIEKMKENEQQYYKVTIVDKKLDAYFKSKVPSGEVTKLVPVK